MRLPKIKGLNPLKLRGRKLLFFVIVLVLVIAGVLVLLQRTSKKSEAPKFTQEEVKMYEDVAAKVNAGQYDQLGDTVKQLQQKPNYEQDAYALYLTVEYYLSQGDIDNAKKYLALYEKAEAKNSEPTAPMVGSVRSTATLKSLVQLREQAKENTSLFFEEAP